MNYREAIQLYQDAAEKLYDLAGVLRDYAEGFEKEHWNDARRQSRELSHNMQRLDTKLPNGKADMILGFEFTNIKINGK
jgi:hypothetical protein